MYPMYNKTEQERLDYETRLIQAAHKEGWVKGFKAGRSTQDEWQALEKIKKAAFDEGYRLGREAGFAGGFAAAQAQPAAKIEAAYEQGLADASKLVPVRKNGGGY